MLAGFGFYQSPSRLLRAPPNRRPLLPQRQQHIQHRQREHGAINPVEPAAVAGGRRLCWPGPPT